MLNVVADQHLYNIAEYLSDDINLKLFDSTKNPLNISENTDALLIRTVTKINPKNFPHFPDRLSFIGSGSAGTDHINFKHLENNNISFANAAGCNARSVGEYIAVVLLLWAEKHHSKISDYTVGIVGVGHTGSAVHKILRRLNINTTLYDPPRESRDPDFISDSLAEVLQCDILTFHVPLNRSTSHPTYYWLNEEKLDNHSFDFIINASRGEIVDEQALLMACKKRTVKNYALDVWVNEPIFADEVARHAFIKTPHIAGYSLQAKERATKMIIKAMFNYFQAAIPISASYNNTTQKKGAPEFWSLTDALTYYHPIRDYETRFKMLIGRADEAKAAGFNRIRTGHPLRDEFGSLNLSQPVLSKFSPLEKLVE